MCVCVCVWIILTLRQNVSDGTNKAEDGAIRLLAEVRRRELLLHTANGAYLRSNGVHPMDAGQLGPFVYHLRYLHDPHLSWAKGVYTFYID